jgi:Protein of unknown function (DUF3261)
MITRSFLLSAAALAVAACVDPRADVASSAVPRPVAFLDHVRPADLGRDVEASQLVSVSRDGDAFTIEVRLSVRAQQLKFVAQDIIGQRLMTVEWNGTEVIEQRSPNLPAFVVPRGMLADLVATCWPENVVRRALDLTGSRLLAQGDQRIILVDNRETMRAVRSWATEAPWTGRLSYRNVRAGYTVDVQSVEQP